MAKKRMAGDNGAIPAVLTGLGAGGAVLLALSAMGRPLSSDEALQYAEQFEDAGMPEYAAQMREAANG